MRAVTNVNAPLVLVGGLRTSLVLVGTQSDLDPEFSLRVRTLLYYTATISQVCMIL